MSAHIMEGRVKILETYSKSEEIISFSPQFSCICRLYTVLAITLSRTAMFWLRRVITQFCLSAYITEGKLKILRTNKKSEEIISLYHVFRAFGHFYCDVVKRNHPCLFRVY